MDVFVPSKYTEKCTCCASRSSDVYTERVIVFVEPARASSSALFTLIILPGRTIRKRQSPALIYTCTCLFENRRKGLSESSAREICCWCSFSLLHRTFLPRSEIWRARLSAVCVAQFIKRCSRVSKNRSRWPVRAVDAREINFLPERARNRRMKLKIHSVVHKQSFQCRRTWAKIKERKKNETVCSGELRKR